MRVALVGPFRSRDVAEVVEATAPAGLPLLAPVATWAGVTRDDEPGCEDDPARHRGTVLRMLARDTEVAARLAADVRAPGSMRSCWRASTSTARSSTGSCAWSACRGPTTPQPPTWSCCAGWRAGRRSRAPRAAGLPVVAFDGVQGGPPVSGLRLVLPFAPGDDPAGTTAARRAASLVADALRGRRDRPRRRSWPRCARSARSTSTATRSTRPSGCGAPRRTGRSSRSDRSSARDERQLLIEGEPEGGCAELGRIVRPNSAHPADIERHPAETHPYPAAVDVRRRPPRPPCPAERPL